MKYEQLKYVMEQIWAKSPEDLTEKGLSLLDHTEQVLGQMGQYIKIYHQEIREVQGVNLTRILLYAALLHDIGKIHPHFQAQIRKGPRFGLRHEILSLAFLEAIDIPEEELAYLAIAVALHHKDWNTLVCGTAKSPSYFRPNILFTDITPLFELGEGISTETVKKVVDILRNAEEIIRSSTGIRIEPYPVLNCSLDLEEAMFKNLSKIHQLTLGLESKRDRGRPVILNEQAIYKGVLVRGLMLSADHLASQNPLILEPGFKSVSEVLKAINRKREELWWHQKKIAESEGHQILIAPTGFGKTEAALLWAGKQREETGINGRLFFLLPYRASMNAMAERLRGYFGDFSTALIHAKSLAKAYEKLIDDGVDQLHAVSEARQRESLARLDATPYRVCSPYQLLRSFFGTRGSEAILCSTLGSQLIFDEVHAYDPKITAMTLATAQYLSNMFHARLLLMSATIPSHLLSLLKTMFPELSTPLTIPKEQLEIVSRHKLEIIPYHIFSDYTLERIKDSAKDNSVLVVVNQISRAIRLFDILKESGLEDIVLLHSRFTVRDRIKKEALLNPRKGRILIATQVVEVSLDINYDIGFFELAPLEALLQRFGRVNRKGERPLPSPVIVTELFEQDSSNSALPYESAHLEQVRLVLRQYLLENKDGKIKEHLIQQYLDASYPQKLKDSLTKELNIKVEQFQRYFIQEFRPYGVKEQSVIKQLRKEWDDLFAGYEVLPEMFLQEARKVNNPFEVTQLLVPISSIQFLKLKKEEKIYKDENLDEYIALCEYDEDKGLLL